MRARLVLQLALATIAAMLSLYFWLRAIGGDPTAPVAQRPISPFERHVVKVFVVRSPSRPHPVTRHRPKHLKHVTLRLAASKAAVAQLTTSAATSSGHSGRTSPAPAAVPRVSPTPPTASPPLPSPPAPPS